MMTLRQVEVIRAVMVAGSINGAAKILNVSAPGISRLVKHAERTLSVRFFDRRNGRFVPTAEARSVFEQIDGVYRKIDDLGDTIAAIARGASSELRVGAVPSIAQVMVPRAVAAVRRRYPDLRFNINVLKLEEVLNHILLDKVECVAMSYRFEHPGLDVQPLAEGELFCIVPEGHALAAQAAVGAAEICRHPLIGIDAADPYGAIMAGLFARLGLAYDVPIKARFGSTVCALVGAGLGIAVIDQFTLTDAPPGVKVLPIAEPTRFQTYVATKRGSEMSVHAAHFVERLRAEMTAADPALPRRGLTPSSQPGRS